MTNGTPYSCFCGIVVNVAHRLHPNLPAGNLSYDPATAVYPNSYSPDKERKVLGIKFKTLEETTKDALDNFKARGWLKNV